MAQKHIPPDAFSADEQSIQQLRQAIETMRQAGQDTAALERLLARLEAARQAESSGREADRPAAQAPRGTGGDMADRDRIVQALAERAVAIGRDAFGNFIITGDNVQVQFAPDELPQVLLEAYHRALAHECRQLPLGIIDASFIRPGAGQPITLDAVYTNLDVVSPPREPDEDARHWGLRLARGEGGERTPLLDAVTSPTGRKLVLLGSAGSGKTTFVNYLTWRMTASPKHREALPAPLRSLLPLRLVLRRVAPYLDAAPKAGALWEALRDDIAARLGEEAAAHLLPYIQRKAAQEGALVMLDGLDEVPEAGKRRQTLLQAITAWVNQFTPNSRFLLTARPYAYADPQWHLEGFQIIALAPFDEDQVRTFVQHWYDAAAPWMEWTPAVTEHKREQLLQALAERPYLADMASRPLLLTLMATLHTHRGQLPEDRAALYEDAVSLLLQRWQEKSQADPVAGQDFQAIRALEVGTLRRMVEELAYRTHERQGKQAPSEEEVQTAAEIPFEEILALFSRYLPDTLNPRVLVDYLEARAGLLISRKEGTYAFLHRSFQEYLAASYLSNTYGDLAQALRERVQADPTWWREVFLLGIGKAAQGGYATAVDILNRLLPQPVNADSSASDLRLAVLVGQAGVDLRLPERAAESGEAFLQVMLQRLRESLAFIVESGALTPAERLEAGDVLGKLGDPRFDPDRLHLPVLLRGRPEPAPLGFVRIPAGIYWLGSPEEDEMAFDDERPLHRVRLPEFWIARYPVTNEQFHHFVEAGGYEAERYWTPEGWAWRQGAEPDFSAIETHPDKDFVRQYKEWVLGRKDRSRPHWWGDLKWGAATRPVVGITWYEALAYCAWLGEQIAAFSHQVSAQSEEEARFWAAVASGRYRFTLPSEAEWEAAARGGLPSPRGRGAGGEGMRIYPWGNEITPDHANYDDTGLGQTSPVGMFPKGATPGTGLLDLGGNVWEWTRSKWGMDFMRPDYGYPYDPADGRERLAGPDLRVVRGGSWFDDRGDARAAFRGRYLPSIFDLNFGFRVVLSLAAGSAQDSGNRLQEAGSRP